MIHVVSCKHSAFPRTPPQSCNGPLFLARRHRCGHRRIAERPSDTQLWRPSLLPGRVVGLPAAALHASPAASMVSASRGALQALLQARAQAQAQARAQAQHQQQQQQQRESLMGFRVAQQQEVHWRSLLAQLGTLAQHAQRQAAVAAEAAAALHRQQQLLATPQPQLPIAPAAVAAPPGGAAAAALRQQQQLVQLLLDKWR